jgi:hypothetical protein
MQGKVYLGGAAYLIGGMAIMVLFSKLGMHSLVPSFLWFLLFAIGQFWWFRCPHCDKTAVIRPSGAASPFVGDRCGYCGKDY